MTQTLTPAEALILTPPQASVYGQPVPNTVMYWGAQVTRYSDPRDNPDATEDPTADAFYFAGQSAAKQGLYSGMQGAEHWNAPALSQTQRSQLCKALSQAGEKIFLPVDLGGEPPSRAFYAASVQGLTSITGVSIGSGSWQLDPSGYQFAIPAMKTISYPDGKQIRVFDLSVYPAGYPIQDWATAMLTVPVLPGVSDPIGVYVGGLNINGNVAQPGQISSYYGPNNGDTRPTGTVYNKNGVEYLKTFMPNGQSNSELGTGGPTAPVIWMQISAAA